MGEYSVDTSGQECFEFRKGGERRVATQRRLKVEIGGVPIELIEMPWRIGLVDRHEQPALSLPAGTSGATESVE